MIKDEVMEYYYRSIGSHQFLVIKYLKSMEPYDERYSLTEIKTLDHDGGMMYSNCTSENISDHFKEMELMYPKKYAHHEYDASSKKISEKDLRKLLTQ